MLIVPSNVTTPTTITLTFKSPVFGPDLSTVTGVTAGMLRRDSTTTTLTFTIISATSRELVAQYTFTGGGEITTTGMYLLAPQLAVQGGSVPSETIPLAVKDPYGLIPTLEQDAFLMGTVPIPSLGPVSSKWQVVSSTTYSVSPFGPNVALDMRGNAVAATLWQALDGDIASFSDIYNQASGGRLFTLNGASGQQVPNGDGTFSASTTRSSAGFALRLRFAGAPLNLWLPW